MAPSLPPTQATMASARSSRRLCRLPPISGPFCSGTTGAAPLPLQRLPAAARDRDLVPAPGASWGEHQAGDHLPGRPSPGGAGESPQPARPPGPTRCTRSISPGAGAPFLPLISGGGQPAAYRFIDHLRLFSLLAQRGGRQILGHPPCHHHPCPAPQRGAVAQESAPVPFAFPSARNTSTTF